MELNKNEIEKRIKMALKILYIKDIYLIENNVEEIAITHKLGMYMENLFPGYDVDCEYNRITYKNGNLAPKKCNKHIVRPDIIVHKRGNNDDNLLALELKKNANNNQEKKDMDKLKNYISELGYSYGIYIDLIPNYDNMIQNGLKVLEN